MIHTKTRVVKINIC